MVTGSVNQKRPIRTIGSQNEQNGSSNAVALVTQIEPESAGVLAGGWRVLWRVDTVILSHHAKDRIAR